jgi:hypothetical protein
MDPLMAHTLEKGTAWLPNHEIRGPFSSLHETHQRGWRVLLPGSRAPPCFREILYTDQVGVYGAPHTPAFLLGRPIFGGRLFLLLFGSLFLLRLRSVQRRPPTQSSSCASASAHCFARVLPFASASATSSLEYWVSSSPSMAAEGQYRLLRLLVRGTTLIHSS